MPISNADSFHLLVFAQLLERDLDKGLSFALFATCSISRFYWAN
jgi:hypothetical protein